MTLQDLKDLVSKVESELQANGIAADDAVLKYFGGEVNVSLEVGSNLDFPFVYIELE